MSQRPESEPNTAYDDRVEERAQLLPEEQAAGSDDPEAQAAAILAESDQRTSDPEGTGEVSTQTTTSRPEPA